MKKSALKRLISVAAIFALSSCSERQPGFAQYWQDWSNQMLTEWQTHSTALNMSVLGYCRGDIELDRVQSSWQELALHWSETNNFPYQAIADNNLEYDLYFWPDKRNMIEQRLGLRVESKEPLTDADMSSTVAAEKGLPAIEWLIHNQKLNHTEQCLALPAITKHYAQQVNAIQTYHQDNPVVQKEWLSNRDSREGASIGLNLSFQQVAHFSSQLRNGLDNDGKPIPLLAEGWRSGETRNIYLRSLFSIIEHTRATLERLNLNAENNQLLLGQVSELTKLYDDMGQTEMIDPETMLRLKAQLVDLEKLIEGPIAEDVGVLIGFNNYDGD